MSALKSEQKEDILVVYFTDAKIVDEARIQQIGKELMEKGEEAAKTKSKNMLLNFQGVQFMSSGMIGKLVLLNKKSRTAGITLRFCSISPAVLAVFEITRLSKTFRIVDDDDDDGDGTAGSLARLNQPPDCDGGRAWPERSDGDAE